MKKAIYTVLLGGYDHIPKPVKKSGWDDILFTDQQISAYGWKKVIVVPASARPDLASRDYKWRSHIHLPEYDLVCYRDANIEIIGKLPDHPFRIIHGRRKSVREEADACNAQVHRCTVESIEEELKWMKEQGFPDETGLFLNGIFARMHTPKENALCEYVWEILNRFTPRDMLALPFAMWKLKYTSVFFQSREWAHKIFRIKRHRITNPPIHGGYKKITVHHITPGRSDRNLGKAINDIVRLLDADDWVCLRDIDCMPMYHEVFYEACEAMANSNKADLIGCVTNRLGLPLQRIEGMYEETDIMQHRKKAIELYEKEGVRVDVVQDNIAGLMMLFSVKIWKKVGGFPEGNIMQNGSFIDFVFSKKVRSYQGKIGIARGIYILHWYRMDKDRKDKSHLIGPKKQLVN